MSEPELTRALARHVAEVSFAALPEHAVTTAKQLVLDTLGVAVAGSREPAATIVRSLGEADGGHPRALLLGTAVRAPAAAAALANGTAAHALDLDDSHHPGFLHPSAVLLPAVLALAEDRDTSGRTAIGAYLVGLDVIAALGSALNLRHYALGWHATATIGTLGAAAAAARVLALDAGRTEVALAVAASQAGGVRRNFGSMAKPLHAGQAARAGVTCALLAERGLSAGERVLEGPRGWFDLVAGPGEWRGDELLALLERPFARATEGLAIKRFASCGVTHPPIEAALLLRNEHGLRPGDVEALELTVNPRVVEIAVHDEPRTGLEAKFSLPHCLAVALIDGAAGLGQFSDERALADDARAVRRRVRVATDPAVGLAGHMSWGCRLRARVRGGPDVAVAVEMARGKWAGERLADAEIEAKFRAVVAGAGMTAGHAQAVVEVVRDLDGLPSARTLARALELPASAVGQQRVAQQRV